MIFFSYFIFWFSFVFIFPEDDIWKDRRPLYVMVLRGNYINYVWLRLRILPNPNVKVFVLLRLRKKNIQGMLEWKICFFLCKSDEWTKIFWGWKCDYVMSSRWANKFMNHFGCVPWLEEASFLPLWRVVQNCRVTTNFGIWWPAEYSSLHPFNYFVRVSLF